MTGVENPGVSYTNRIRSMSRQYFTTALGKLPKPERETVEHDLGQLLERLAKLEALNESKQSSK